MPLALLFGLVTLSGCKKQNAYQPPPPPPVGVAHPLARDVTPYLYATGTTAAYNAVDLVARVQGFIQAIGYTDGQEAKAGTSLFTIEPAPFKMKLQQAQSQLASAQAQVLQADAEFRRQSSLARNNFASQSTLDQKRATLDSDNADVGNQQAGVALAAINLGYTNVTAPFDGVVTAHLVSVGDLVGVSGPTKLASIVQLAPIYVNFSLPEAEVQRIRATLSENKRTLADLGRVAVQIGLANETGYPHEGTLDYVAPLVDSGTGTLAVRAVLPNKAHALLPGYFVRIRIPRAHQTAPGLLVPDAALGNAQSGPYLLVVNAQNIVEQRNVRTGDTDGELRVIEAGLKPDDRVVITGLTRAVPGEKVAPTPAELPAG